MRNKHNQPQQQQQPMALPQNKPPLRVQWRTEQDHDLHSITTASLFNAKVTTKSGGTTMCVIYCTAVDGNASMSDIDCLIALLQVGMRIKYLFLPSIGVAHVVALMLVVVDAIDRCEARWLLLARHTLASLRL
jgi:hypothetical protein